MYVRLRNFVLCTVQYTVKSILVTGCCRRLHVTVRALILMKWIKKIHKIEKLWNCAKRADFFSHSFSVMGNRHKATVKIRTQTPFTSNHKRGTKKRHISKLKNMNKTGEYFDFWGENLILDSPCPFSQLNCHCNVWQFRCVLLSVSYWPEYELYLGLCLILPIASHLLYLQ